jgi:hypothetical protein
MTKRIQMEIRRRRNAETWRHAASLLCLFSASFLVLCLVLPVAISMVGCGAKGVSIDVLFDAANAQLARAQKQLSLPADQRAEAAAMAFEEARALLAQAEIALENGGEEARSIIQKAHAKARFAEALSRQSKAEAAAKLAEAELEKALAEARHVRLERAAAESELKGDQ